MTELDHVRRIPWGGSRAENPSHDARGNQRDAAEPEAVDVAEAARLLGFTAASVRRLVANGTLVVVPIASRYRIPMSEIRRLVVVGVPERSRWGKRLARPQPSAPVASSPAQPAEPAERERGELQVIRELVEELYAEVAKMSVQPRVFRVRDAARRLSLSRTTLRELIMKGTVGTVLIGKRTMVPAKEIERLVTIPESGSGREAERSARERRRAWRKLKASGLA